MPWAVEEVETALLTLLTDLWAWWRQGMTPVLESWKARADGEAWRTFLLDGALARCRVLDIAPDGVVALEDEAGDRHSIPASRVLLGED